MVEDRWATSQYGNEPYRTLITYKESLDSTQTDPAIRRPGPVSGEIRASARRRRRAAGERSDGPALGCQLLLVRGSGAVHLLQAADLAKYSRGQLPSGQTYTMPDETLGYEWDEDVDNGFRPAGEIDMSKTCENVDSCC